MLIILHVQQRMLQSTVKMTAYQQMLHAFKTAVEVKEWLNFYFSPFLKLSPIYTRCTTRTVGFGQNLSSVKNVCDSVHVILGSVRTIVLAIPIVIMDVHALMKGKGLTCLYGLCYIAMSHRLSKKHTSKCKGW